MMKLLYYVLLILLLSCSEESPTPIKENELIGAWKIDLTTTMANFNKEKITQSQKDYFLEERYNSYLIFSKKYITAKQNNIEKKLPYKIISSNKNSVTISIGYSDDSFNSSFKINEKYLIDITKKYKIFYKKHK